MGFVDCFCLGHAGWLFEAAGLRLLVDPLIWPGHHRGVFVTSPTRTLDAAALRPDFLLISHAHRDHFDLKSLDALARIDPDVTVFSADERVCEAARALGFSSASRVGAGSVIELDGVRLVTTPSAGEDEWGVLIEHEGAAVWHLVDSVLTAGDVARLRGEMARQLGLPSLAERGPDLSLVRHQPLLEVALALGDAGRFPLRGYAQLLEVAAALGQGALVPSSSASVHALAFEGMNSVVYPQTERRFLRDLAAIAPSARPMASQVGGLFRVSPGQVAALPSAGRSLIADEGREVDTAFRPFAPPALVELGAARGAAARAEIEGWVGGPLREGLRGLDGVLVLEVIDAGGREAFTLRAGGGEVAIERGFDGEYDLLNAVTASALAGVIRGELAWADALLAGQLRVSDRRCDVSPAGVKPGPNSPLFVYMGLSYDESEGRALASELRSLLEARGGRGLAGR